ncbi:glutathione S-transferase U25-like isoform X1 [Silene latifolia]|uniref:glutathione S-transferase U25-like isoform X1 n=1 Tax=Silene latifolia TaxID=37657 RepID=UPI003D77D65D
MADEIVLLEFWPSPFSTRVKIALQEKGITNYDSRQEDFKSKSTLLLTMNPVHKKIPVLIHNGKPICESLAIIEYIDEEWKHNSPTLLPTDPYHRAQARFWADFNDKMFFHTLRKVWRQKDGANEEDKKEFVDLLRKLEVELGDKPYFGGDTFGYLDVVLIPDYSWFYAFEKCTQVNIEAECPTLVSWGKRCMERDSVKTCLPDQFRIHDYVLELKKRFGND